MLSLAYSPDGKILASMNSRGGQADIMLWEAGTNQVRTTISSHPLPSWRIAFAPDGKTLAASCYERTIKLWDVATGRERLILSTESDPRGLSFAPDGRTLAASQLNGAVQIFDLTNGWQQAALRGHTGLVFDVTFAPDGRGLASAGATGRFGSGIFPRRRPTPVPRSRGGSLRDAPPPRQAVRTSRCWQRYKDSRWATTCCWSTARRGCTARERLRCRGKWPRSSAGG